MLELVNVGKCAYRADRDMTQLHQDRGHSIHTTLNLQGMLKKNRQLYKYYEPGRNTVLCPQILCRLATGISHMDG